MLYDVWGRYYTRGNVYNYIEQLRKRLRRLDAAKTIKTDRQVGYIYSPPVSSKANCRASDIRSLEYF